jgi:hypothetical protein
MWDPNKGCKFCCWWECQEGGESYILRSSIIHIPPPPAKRISPCDLFRFRITFRNYESCRQMVGLLGRVIRRTQGRYLHRTAEHRKRDKDPCRKRDSNPLSQRPSDQGLCLKQRGHWDQPDSYATPNIIRMIKARKVRWSRNVERMERLYIRAKFWMKDWWEENTGRRWKDNIKMDISDNGLEGVDLIDLAQDRDRWRVLVNKVINLLVL